MEGHVIQGLVWSTQAPEGAAANVPTHVDHVGRKQLPHGLKGDTSGHSPHVGEAWRMLMAQCAHRLVLARHERDAELQALPALASIIGAPALPAATKNSLSGPEFAHQPNGHVGALKAFFPSPSGTLLHGFIPRVLSEVFSFPGSHSGGPMEESLPIRRSRGRSFKHVPLTSLLGTPAIGQHKPRAGKASHLRGLGVRVRMLGNSRALARGQGSG